MEALVMSSLRLVTHLLSSSVSAIMSLLPLVPILYPFCHLDTITPYHVTCQGCSLQLTGTRGLVGEGGVEGVVNAFRG